MQRLHIRMVLRIPQHTGDDPPLFGYAQALFLAKGFDIDGARHAVVLNGMLCEPS